MMDTGPCTSSYGGVWGSRQVLHEARFQRYSLTQWDGCLTWSDSVFADGFEGGDLAAWD